jgi:hypothetical protein
MQLFAQTWTKLSSLVSPAKVSSPQDAGKRESAVKKEPTSLSIESPKSEVQGLKRRRQTEIDNLAKPASPTPLSAHKADLSRYIEERCAEHIESCYNLLYIFFLL